MTKACAVYHEQGTPCIEIKCTCKATTNHPEGSWETDFRERDFYKILNANKPITDLIAYIKQHGDKRYEEGVAREEGLWSLAITHLPEKYRNSVLATRKDLQALIPNNKPNTGVQKEPVLIIEDGR